MPLFEDKIHKALASETRREILLALAEEEKYLTQIAEEIDRKPQTVDFHLNLLADIGMVESEWEEGKKYYKLKNKNVLKYLKKGKPIPERFRPKPPHEIMLEAWDDIKERLDRLEKKVDELSEKVEK